MKFQEKIICNNCKTVHYREIEVLQSLGRYSNFDQPLNMIIVKKFECPKCKENENYSINLVLKNEKVKKII